MTQLWILNSMRLTVTNGLMILVCMLVLFALYPNDLLVNGSYAVFEAVLYLTKISRQVGFVV